jgi:hypothetical protein
MKIKFTFLFISILFLGQIGYAQTIETAGIGVFNEATSTLTFDNINNIDHVVVEAIFKATSFGITPDGPVTFSDVDEAYSSFVIPVEHLYTQNGTDYGANPGYFQATFNTVDANGISLDQLNNVGYIHSFIAYVYRNVDNGFESIANMDHAFFFWNGESSPGIYTLPLDPVTEARDLTAKITISEMAEDSRICVYTVSAGGISVTDTINQPDPLLGSSLNIIPVTLYDVPGDATELTVSIYSPDYPYNAGDSFITSAVIVDVEGEPSSPGEYCTLTQGYYGNSGGLFNGQTTAELLWDLLETDLVLGGDGNTLTLTQNDVDCVISRLPGGGKARVLNGEATCDNPVGIPLHRSGRFKNNFVSQAITFGLNLRLDGNLGDLLLADIDFLVSDNIRQELGSGATVDDLFDFVNLALAGGGVQGVSLGDITSTIGKINDYFDECNSLEKEAGFSFKNSSISNDNLNISDASISIFPNPVVMSSTIEFELIEQAFTTIELINFQGQVVKRIFNGNTVAGIHTASLNVSDVKSGIYFLRLVSGSETVNQKISILK